MNKILSDRTNKMDASAYKRLFDLIHSRKDMINLSVGQAHYDVPEPIKAVAAKAINDGFNKYTPTQGLPELVEKLKTTIERNTGHNPYGVMVTNGAAGALLLSFMVLLDAGDDALVPDPYFLSYLNLLAACDANPVFIDTCPDFKLTPEKIEKSITPRTKILIFNNPVNPTGTAYTEKEIKAIADTAARHKITVISDEVYDHFSYDFPHVSALKFHPENTAYINAFSKTYGVPGWRMGYLAVPELMWDKVTMLQQFSYVCTPAPFQKAMLFALDFDMSLYHSEYEKKRDMACEMLKDSFEFVKPQGTFYMYVKVPFGTDLEFVEKAARNGLLIIPGSACSQRHTHFRMSFAAPDEKLIKGLNILKSLLI